MLLDGVRSLSKGVRKVRQHVNPLQTSYQRPLQLADTWIESAYPAAAEGQRAFVVDVGCAEGRFTLQLARESRSQSQSQSQSLCVLGLEIRRPMVRHCLQEAQRLGVDNVHFLACNANVDLANVLRSIQRQGHRVQSVLFQFPDPHFKRRHHKRRVVNFALVRSLAETLPQGTQLFVQTDIEALAKDMVFRAGSTPWFSPAAGYDMHALDSNASPHAVRTDRENKTLARGEPVYRMLFVRNDVPYDALWQEPPEPEPAVDEDEEQDEGDESE